MRTPTSLLLARIVATLFVAPAVGLIGYGLLCVIDDQSRHDDLYDGLGAGLGAMMIVGGLVLLLPVAVVLLARRPAVAAAAAAVLAAVLVVLAVQMHGDYAPWPVLAMALALVMAVGCLVAARSGREAERVVPAETPIGMSDT